MVGAEGFEPPTSCSQSRHDRWGQSPKKAECFGQWKVRPHKRPQPNRSPVARRGLPATRGSIYCEISSLWARRARITASPKSTKITSTLARNPSPASAWIVTTVATPHNAFPSQPSSVIHPVYMKKGGTPRRGTALVSLSPAAEHTLSNRLTQPVEHPSPEARGIFELVGLVFALPSQPGLLRYVHGVQLRSPAPPAGFVFLRHYRSLIRMVGSPSSLAPST